MRAAGRHTCLVLAIARSSARERFKLSRATKKRHREPSPQLLFPRTRLFGRRLPISPLLSRCWRHPVLSRRRHHPVLSRHGRHTVLRLFLPPRLIGDDGVLISGHYRCQFLPSYAIWVVLKYQARQGTWWHLGKHDGTPRQSFQKLLTGALPAPSSSEKPRKGRLEPSGDQWGMDERATAMAAPKMRLTQLGDAKN